MIQLIKPNWSAPVNIRAFSTTRVGGVSKAPFDSLNLGLHVGDDEVSVMKNRQRLQKLTAHRPVQWLNQIHSNKVVEYSGADQLVEADAIVTSKSSATCAVMTADCLPVLMTNSSGNWVAAAHAGWRGLADGVLVNTVSSYDRPEPLMAWIGPSISQKCFEVGSEVREAFLEVDASNQTYFVQNYRGRWQADLAGLAKKQLETLGVAVYLSQLCTFSNDHQFYSYRRDGQTGRMASMIWISE
ncbi:peptidoglycan editing factor PgeF [Kangiella profundi]|uniref:Purine nucleoside phosphorylase n=1 Tax=Kangiella profundi TaxID=1561924 RepID=A0A2K9AU34_9GAMM|nr:peptidoglycan editing factor PgeF [Kangiella profundi]AUD78671.1 peptidoglycan editing factor PgeF [Kangiella profundi]GGF09998.1 laccase domain protein [Kangiella profundi]